jgi:hypothetical protein
MRWHIGWQGLALAVLLFGTGLLLGSYRHMGEPIHSTAGERLRPSETVRSESAASGTVYVPVYAALYLGVPNRARTVDLAATVSVRNVSTAHPVTLDSVRYYDSLGKKIRDYLDTPSTLPPMGSVEFVIQRSDTAGGPGANFLIHWHAPAVVDEPLIEAVMVGESGGAGISFTSRGRALKSASEP